MPRRRTATPTKHCCGFCELARPRAWTARGIPAATTPTVGERWRPKNDPGWPGTWHWTRRRRIFSFDFSSCSKRTPCPSFSVTWLNNRNWRRTGVSSNWPRPSSAAGRFPLIVAPGCLPPRHSWLAPSSEAPFTRPQRRRRQVRSPFGRALQCQPSLRARGPELPTPCRDREQRPRDSTSCWIFCARVECSGANRYRCMN